jgi:hypothetical protein
MQKWEPSMYVTHVFPACWLTVINACCVFSSSEKKQKPECFALLISFWFLKQGSGSDGSYRNLLGRKGEFIFLKTSLRFPRAQWELSSGGFLLFHRPHGWYHWFCVGQFAVGHLHILVYVKESKLEAQFCFPSNDRIICIIFILCTYFN